MFCAFFRCLESAAFFVFRVLRYEGELDTRVERKKKSVCNTMR